MKKNKFLYPEQQRLNLMTCESYEKVSKIWNSCNISSEQNTGSLPYLVKTAARKMSTSMSYLEWEKYYLESGEKRKEEIEALSKNTYQCNQYCGRTMDDILVIAKDFYERVRETSGINLGKQTALNVVYCKLVDEPYMLYRRQVALLNKMNGEQNEIHYELAEPLVSTENAVDIIGYNSDGDIVAAYQVISRKTPDEIKNGFKEKHSLFKLLYDVEVEFLF